MYNTRLQTWKLTNLSLSSGYTNKLCLSIKKKSWFLLTACSTTRTKVAKQWKRRILIHCWRFWLLSSSTSVQKQKKRGVWGGDQINQHIYVSKRRMTNWRGKRWWKQVIDVLPFDWNRNCSTHEYHLSVHLRSCRF